MENSSQGGIDTSEMMASAIVDEMFDGRSGPGEALGGWGCRCEAAAEQNADALFQKKLSVSALLYPLSLSRCSNPRSVMPTAREGESGRRRTVWVSRGRGAKPLHSYVDMARRFLRADGEVMVTGLGFGTTFPHCGRMKQSISSPNRIDARLPIDMFGIANAETEHHRFVLPDRCISPRLHTNSSETSKTPSRASLRLMRVNQRALILRSCLRHVPHHLLGIGR